MVIWLEHIKLKQYISNFRSNGIDGGELYELTEEDIDDRLGITKKQHKKKLFNAIKKLKYAQADKDAKKAEKKGGGKKKGGGGLAIEKTTNVGRKKVKEKGLDVDLYVAGTKYDCQVICTFCQMEDKFALVFCPACGQKGDFLCEDCDAEVHHHVKRRSHVRTVLSVLDLDDAGQIIISFVRYVACRTNLLKRCRDTFDRFYSANKRMHYYYNLQTGKVQVSGLLVRAMRREPCFRRLTRNCFVLRVLCSLHHPSVTVCLTLPCNHPLLSIVNPTTLPTHEMINCGSSNPSPVAQTLLPKK